MSSLLDFKQALGIKGWFLMIQLSRGQGHGMNAIQADQYFKVLFKVGTVCANKVGKPAKHLFYFVTLICFEATNLVIQLKCFEWLHKNGCPACRLVVKDPIDPVSVGFFYWKDPPSLSHGDQAFLEDTCAPQPAKQGLKFFSQPFTCPGHLTANGGQIRACLVKNFQGLQINTLADLLHKNRVGGQRGCDLLKEGKI